MARSYSAARSSRSRRSTPCPSRATRRRGADERRRSRYAWATIAAFFTLYKHQRFPQIHTTTATAYKQPVTIHCAEGSSVTHSPLSAAIIGKTIKIFHAEYHATTAACDL